jgi:alpha-amylase/alpha-mannosidase (GH57 family)
MLSKLFNRRNIILPMSTDKKFVCIHGHFYQPPRENAWLEVLETQDSAAPFHDWNERINFECYAPNARARILDDVGYIRQVVNNYTRMSFNFGPTLLSWMEQADPETYRAIIEADRASVAKFDGHGSAIAQVYSHLIMPLANARDQRTQLEWGLYDFEQRFGRKSEGIWLAETAVDHATLELLVDYGLKYTILAPRQAKAVRPTADAAWIHLDHAAVDPRRPYRCILPSGREITLFFYDGHVAQAVAFEGLLNDGALLANRLVQTLDQDDQVQLAHIATDGESYGHHHKKGEMALASCLDMLENHADVELTNYGAFLAQHPATWEVEIYENSSWSCVHGVERWRSDCGCHSGGRPDWTQAWRKPLRETLDWLRDQLIPIYEFKANELLLDPWAARNAYIRIILDRSDDNWQTFCSAHAKGALTEAQQIQLQRLLEMQRHAVLMYTSCGWFFDEISGLETNQILQYANRAIYYARQVIGIDLHQEFVERLATAPSNVYENGAVSYQKNVVPARVNLERVGMHFAVASLFEQYPEQMELFNYRTECEVFEKLVAGKQTLAIGRVTVRSRITRSRKHFSFAALHLGQQNIIGNISTQMDAASFREMLAELRTAFETSDLGRVIVLMQDYIGSDKFSIQELFVDEKRKVLKRITDRSLRHIRRDFRQIYDSNYQLMTGMQSSEIPLPEAYRTAIKYVLNEDLHQFFQDDHLDQRMLKRLVSEFEKWGVSFTSLAQLSLKAGERLFKALRQLDKEADLARLQRIVYSLKQVRALDIELDLWKSQNLLVDRLPIWRENSLGEEWTLLLDELSDLLKVRVEVLVAG